MFRLKDENIAPINLNENKIKCSYCGEPIKDENYLYCLQCRGYVHVKCLRHASTPGDLLGDVFFDFTCAKCMQLNYDGPSTSKGCAKEKFVRQRLPWILVITLALYNLSIKSKGLSHHGYFHWKTHVVNFIDKNWDFLFEPHVKKKKQWIGSVTGNMSHNSPEFFQSGQDKFGESGWWKLTHENKHPRYIFNQYEKFSQKRALLKNGKRRLEENADVDVEILKKEIIPNEVKRLRLTNPEEDLLANYVCSRSIPYMGRKPRVASKLFEVNHEPIPETIKPEPEPFNTVQSSLMDFLAESLASDDLSLFNNLPITDPLVGDGFEKNDFLLPSLSDVHENGHMNAISAKKQANGGKTIENTNHDDDKLKSFYNQIEVDDSFNLNSVDENSLIDPTTCQSLNKTNSSKKVKASKLKTGKATKQESVSKKKENSLKKSNDLRTNHKAENNKTVAAESGKTLIETGDSNDATVTAIAEELKPRIIQITNFQQLNADPAMLQVKTEHWSEDEDKVDREEAINTAVKNIKNEIEIEDVLDDNVQFTPLPPCKPSLFTKCAKREDPWLVEERNKPKTSLFDFQTENNTDKDKEVKVMSLYEERSLLSKLKDLFEDEHANELDIPAYLRRYYKKLCVREWKRQHGKPIFDIDSFMTGEPTPNNTNDAYLEPSKGYHLLYKTMPKATATFRDRLMGSSDYELFQSPYSGRILHPFIFRNSKCLPPRLKLMLEVKYCVTGQVPDRASIDYCYVRPNHIPAVNALLESTFWPGIDMTECLTYPDYTVVALYKKLIIGCGFIVPDAGFNEAYISFMAVRPGWQNSGIGTFMLYHLIQTCLSKDIVLHVSATNPAVLLYQKFGFKIEEVVLNFYDKYLPFESKDSRTAFFLRLNR